MGQQQLLLIVLGTILVVLAIMIGINLFQTNAVDQNRAALWNDLNHIGSMAQGYFRRSTTFGGGGQSFIGFKLYPGQQANDNGTFVLVGAPSAHEVVVQAKGKEIGIDGTDSVLLIMVIHPDEMYIDQGRGFN